MRKCVLFFNFESFSIHLKDSKRFKTGNISTQFSDRVFEKNPLMPFRPFRILQTYFENLDKHIFSKSMVALEKKDQLQPNAFSH